MGKLYNDYPSALSADPPTECKFSLPFSLEPPTIKFPPDLPIFDFAFIIPSPPFFCPLDD